MHNFEKSYCKALLIKNEVSVHRRHLCTLVMEVFSSLNNINPE